MRASNPITGVVIQWQCQFSTDAVTEYQCDRALYRDVELNGQPQTQTWSEITADPLNQAVMDYACNPS